MLKHALFSLLTFAAFTAPVPAFAGKKSFIIDGGLFRSFDPVRVDNGVDLDKGGITKFGVNFIVPKGYIKNSPIKLQVRLSVDETNCSTVFRPGHVYRNRPGFKQLISVAGLSASEPDVFEVPSSVGKVFTRSFTLTKTGAGTIPDQRAGDHLYITFGREVFETEDTCMLRLKATSMKVIYSVN